MSPARRLERRASGIATASAWSNPAREGISRFCRTRRPAAAKIRLADADIGQEGPCTARIAQMIHEEATHSTTLVLRLDTTSFMEASLPTKLWLW
jgi:hypothetical protein